VVDSRIHIQQICDRPYIAWLGGLEISALSVSIPNYGLGRRDRMESRLILVVDDDNAICDVVAAKLEDAGFRTVKASTGQEGFEAVEKYDVDLIILDLGLPDIDGVTICQRLRHSSAVPIIMLTARAEEVNRIVGLEVGADDYITKPFSLNELIARVKAVLRRVEPDAGIALPQMVTKVGDITIDTEAHEVKIGDAIVDLTPTEFSLLLTLARKPGRVFSHIELLRSVWDYDQYDTHLVEVHIANLRSKIEKDSTNSERIVTVRAVGYKLVPQ